VGPVGQVAAPAFEALGAYPGGCRAALLLEEPVELPYGDVVRGRRRRHRAVPGLVRGSTRRRPARRAALVPDMPE
jgi:hypothetical protein